MHDEYLWAWVDRGDRVAVLKVRGELDAVTADEFAVEAVRLLKRIDGPVAVDLSLLEFVDCAGARMLAAVLDTIPSWRLVEVCGIRPRVRRLLDLVGLDPRPARASRHSDVVPSARGQKVLAEVDAVRWQSRALMLETSVVMDRLATTYAEMAARGRRGERERTAAERMRVLSATARDLSSRYRQRAMAGTGQAG